MTCKVFKYNELKAQYREADNVYREYHHERSIICKWCRDGRVFECGGFSNDGGFIAEVDLGIGRRKRIAK